MNCPIHPKYKARRSPRSECPSCWYFYNVMRVAAGLPTRQFGYQKTEVPSESETADPSANDSIS